MAAQTNLQRDVLVLNMEQQLMEVAKEMFGKSLAELTDQETYYTVLAYAKRVMSVSDTNEGEKRFITFQQNF